MEYGCVMRQTRFRLPARAAAVGTALAAVLAGGLAVSPSAQAADISAQQWYLDVMEAPRHVEGVHGQGDDGGLVDTGVNAQQPELRGKVLAGEVMGGRANGHQDKAGTARQWQ